MSPYMYLETSLSINNIIEALSKLTKYVESHGLCGIIVQAMRIWI